MLWYTIKNVQWKYEYVSKDLGLDSGMLFMTRSWIYSLYYGCYFKRACIYSNMVLYFFTYSVLWIAAKILIFHFLHILRGISLLIYSQIDLTYILFVTISQRIVSCLFLLNSLFYQDVMWFTKLMSLEF